MIYIRNVLIGVAILSMTTATPASPAGPARETIAAPASVNPWSTFGPSCRQEIRTYCAGVVPGQGRMLACLRNRQLSPDCGAAVGRLSGAR